MKKFRITVKKNAPDTTLWLFQDIDSLSQWRHGCYANRDDLETVNDVQKLVIAPDDKVEIEWIGSSYGYAPSYDDEQISAQVLDRMMDEDFECFHLIKIAKASKQAPSSNRKGLILTCHSGWICEEILKLCDDDPRFNVKRIDDSQSELLMPNDDTVAKRVVETTTVNMRALKLHVV